jgi:restriction endonuclease S subunit
MNPDDLSDSTPDDFRITYVDIGSVTQEKGISRTEEYDFITAPSRARRLVREGDTIISTVRTYLKAVAAIQNHPDNMVVSTGFAVLRPSDGVIANFLYRAVQSDLFISRVVSLSEGVGYPAIAPSTLVRSGLLDEAFDEDGVPWVKPDHLQGDRGIATTDRRLAPDAAASIGTVPAGSVLVSGIGTVGKTGYASSKVCTNQQINAISFRAEIIDRYGQFAVSCLGQEFSMRSNKVTIAICKKSEMGDVTMCIPPPAEQLAIDAFLDRETSRIDALVAKVRTAIDRLKEYRIALISAAVTGKIDVREEVSH